MMENLFEILDRFFLVDGFQKSKFIWYKKVNDGYLVFEFQKFKYDRFGSGFINFGVSFTTNKINVKEPKGEATWDLRGRVTRFENKQRQDELFKIEISDDTQRRRLDVVLEGIKNETIPFLEHYSYLTNLIDDLKHKKFDFSRALTSIVP